MTAPCKDCERRCVGCHASCSDYAGWQESREPILAERQRLRDAERMLCRMVQKQIWHSMKRRR